MHMIRKVEQLPMKCACNEWFIEEIGGMHGVCNACLDSRKYSGDLALEEVDDEGE